jgi:hypothetical protein
MIGRDPKYFLLRLRKSWNNLKCRNLIVAALTLQVRCLLICSLCFSKFISFHKPNNLLVFHFVPKSLSSRNFDNKCSDEISSEDHTKEKMNMTNILSMTFTA